MTMDGALQRLGAMKGFGHPKAVGPSLPILVEPKHFGDGQWRVPEGQVVGGLFEVKVHPAGDTTKTFLADAQTPGPSSFRCRISGNS